MQHVNLGETEEEQNEIDEPELAVFVDDIDEDDGIFPQEFI